jgi:hypothetical protein
MAARRPKQLLYSLTHTCSVGAVCAAVCAGAGVCGAYRTRLKAAQTAQRLHCVR